MHVVIGRVRIKPGFEDQTLAMVGEHGVGMLRAWRARPGDIGRGRWMGRNMIQHSVWLFDTEANARGAEATFNTLREMPDAPATFISVDVCEVIGQA